MANSEDQKLKEMEAEMDRFEEEISAARAAGITDIPKFIIGSNTFNQVQSRLKGPEDLPRMLAPPRPPIGFTNNPADTNRSQPGGGNSNRTVPHLQPPPPPPSSTSPSYNMRQPPPPPPRPPSFMPPQLRNRGPPPGRPLYPPPSHGGPPGMPPPPRPPSMGHSGPPPRHMGPPPGHGQQSPHMMGPPPGMRPPNMHGGPSHMGMSRNQRPQGPPPMYNRPPVTSAEEKKPSPVIQKGSVIYAAPQIIKPQPSLPPALPKPIVEEPPQKKLDTGFQHHQPQVPEVVEPAMGHGAHMMLGEGPSEVDADYMGGEGSTSKRKDKKKKFVRAAAGQQWEDPTLGEWDPSDFRMFCGDLGNEVTDELLTRTFSRYPTFVKARVVRDKRSNKTKGYGFVSFKDPNDFVKATREMNGKYVGNRPIKLRKSTWKDRQVETVRKKDKDKKRLGFK